MKKKDSKSKVGRVVAVGAAAVAAGAATYALVGPHGKENRAKVKKAVIDMKNKVVSNKEVKMVANEIKKAVTGAKKDVKSMASNAKSAVKKTVSNAKNVAKKTAKSAVKKAVKKATKK